MRRAPRCDPLATAPRLRFSTTRGAGRSSRPALTTNNRFHLVQNSRRPASSLITNAVHRPPSDPSRALDSRPTAQRVRARPTGHRTHPSRVTAASPRDAGTVRAQRVRLVLRNDSTSPRAYAPRHGRGRISVHRLGRARVPRAARRVAGCERGRGESASTGSDARVRLELPHPPRALRPIGRALAARPSAPGQPDTLHTRAASLARRRVTFVFLAQRPLSS